MCYNNYKHHNNRNLGNIARVSPMEKIDPMSPESYYLQLEEILIRRIRKGDFKGQNRLPTVNELSKMYKVAQLTVRRAIQDLTERGFIYKRRGKGIFVREEVLSPDLANKKKRVILVLLPSLMDLEGAHMLTGIEKAASSGRGEDIQLDIRCYDWQSKLEKSYLTKFISGDYSGLLFRPSPYTDREYVHSLTECGKPFVLIDRHFPDLPTNVVTMNYSHIAYLLTRLLIKNGKRKICYLAYADPKIDVSGSCSFIRKGYRKALQDFQVPEIMLSGLGRDVHSDEEIEAKILNFLKSHKDMGAFLVASGYLGRKLLSAGKKMGDIVLSDIQIAGFDLDSSLAYEGIPFITANRKHVDLGYIAISRMTKLLAREEGPVIREFIKSDIKRCDGHRNYERIGVEEIDQSWNIGRKEQRKAASGFRK